MYDVGCNKTMLVICYSSALHLLARLQRTRSFGRLPYEDLAPKALMKTSFQRTFVPKYLRKAEL